MPSELEDLVRRFASAVQAQNECIHASDAARGNEFAREYIESGKSLLSAGAPGIELFASLLYHENLGVRVMAGAFLLQARAPEVVSVLEPISRGKGLEALGAKMTLERYRRGELGLSLG